jgi:hypothetical protein
MRLCRRNKGGYSMKTWKQSTLFGILAIIAIVFAFGCNGNSLSGTWESKNNRINFSGKNFTSITFFPTILGITLPPIETKGTYSLENDKIEFLYSDGSAKVSSFFRTKNTIAIGGDLYIRMNIDPIFAEQQAERQKEQQKEEQNGYYVTILQTLANIMGEYDTIPEEKRRDTFDFILSSMLVNENIVQIYTVWGPYALDSMDSKYGQYKNSFSRESGQMTIGTISDVSSIMSWLNGFDSRENQIGNPTQKNIYGYGNKFIIDIMVPIIHSRTGRVVGGAGCIFIDTTQ